MLHAAVPDGHEWLRVADPGWDDPIDPSYSLASGGRWNPPGTWPALYLSHDVDTARRQIVRMLEGTPFEPDDLADDSYDIRVTLPDQQTALDVVSEAGVAAVGLPSTYPATAWVYGALCSPQPDREGPASAHHDLLR